MYYDGYEYKWNKKWEELKPIYRMYFMLISHKLSEYNKELSIDLYIKRVFKNIYNSIK